MTSVSRAKRAAAAALLLLLFTLTSLCMQHAHASIFEPQRFPVLSLSAFERRVLRECPCSETSQCLPVGFGVRADDMPSLRQEKKEVFAFSVTTSDQWKHYDWEQVRPIVCGCSWVVAAHSDLFLRAGVVYQFVYLLLLVSDSHKVSSPAPTT